jgi:hypothetical protein
LTNFAFAATINEPEFIGMGMNVNETRSQYEAIARNTLDGVAIGQITNRYDSTVGHPDIRGKRRTAPSVVDDRMLEDRTVQRLT